MFAAERENLCENLFKNVTQKADKMMRKGRLPTLELVCIMPAHMFMHVPSGAVLYIKLFRFNAFEE